MAIAGWRLRISRRQRVGILLSIIFACVILFCLSIRHTQRRSLIAQLQVDINDQAWAQVTSDLSYLWGLTMNGQSPPPWFHQALSDLVQLQSTEVDTTAQAQLVSWLCDSGAQAAAHSLLEANQVVIPAGVFLMGSETRAADESPMRRVTLRTYSIDRFEVTHLQYKTFLESSGGIPPVYWQGNSYPLGRDIQPVVGVSWYQAQAYCVWAGKRLPSEAEWERACRGENGDIYPWGGEWIEDYANLGLDWSVNWPVAFDDAWDLLGQDSTMGLQDVGRFPTGLSAYGIADMVGNAAEWVWDWYDADAYSRTPDRDPVSYGPFWNHGIRGNGWFSRLGWDDSVPQASRCSARSGSHSYDDPRVGFRCAQDIETHDESSQ